MKLSRRSILSMLLVCAILVGAICLTSCVKEKELTVTEYLDKVMEKTAEVRTAGPVAQAKNVVNNSALKYDFSFKTTDDLKLLLGEAFSSITVSAVKSEEVSQGTLKYETGTQNGEITCTTDGTSVALQSSAMPDKVYGTDLTKLKENYKNSVFADPGSKYYLKIEDFERQTEGSTAFKDIENLLKPYCETLKETLDGDCTAMEKLEEGGRRITVKLDNEAVIALAKKLAGIAKEDTDLRAMLETLCAQFDDTDSAKKAIDEFYAAEDVGAKVDEFFEKEVKAGITVTEVIETDAENLLRLYRWTFEAQDEEKSGKATFTCDLTSDEKSTVTLDLSDFPADDLPFKKASLIHGVSENNDQSYKSYISFAVESKTLNAELKLVDFAYDLTAKTYETEIHIPDSASVTLKGALNITENTLDLTVTEVSSDSLSGMLSMLGGGKTLKVDLTLHLDRNADKPTMPAYTEVLTLPEEEIDRIAEQFESLAENPVEYRPL